MGFSADGSQSDSCCQSASRQENCTAPIWASANDLAASTLGVGAGAGAGVAEAAVAAGAATFCVTDVDPRAAPSERETVAARSPKVSSLGLKMRLAIGLAPAVIDTSAAGKRGVAGAISMRAATSVASAAVVTDAIESSSRIPFLGWAVGERAVRDHFARSSRWLSPVNAYRGRA
jgi:shikimate 5-dehydrogenase